MRSYRTLITLALLLISPLVSAETGSSLSGSTSSAGTVNTAVGTGTINSTSGTLISNIGVLTGATVVTTTNVMVTSPAEALTVLTRLVQAYEARIRQLEAENDAMRAQLVRAKVIKLPLVANPPTVISPIAPGVTFTGTDTPPPSTPVTPVDATPPKVTEVPVVVTVPDTSVTDRAIETIRTMYNASYAGFIKKIHEEWEQIKSAYTLPKDAVISAYEFVQTADKDQVFVDIVSSPSYTGSVYEWKILYQFDPTSFKRKLIGYFELDKKLERYVTVKWGNPFGGVKRVEVKDPFLGKNNTPPLIISNPTLPVTTASGASQWQANLVPTTNASTVSLSDIQQAYSGKRYLSVISLSNSYLESNAPTLEILRMRYRTFFIIGKYSESLKDIQKIQALQGSLDRTIACDAQVIATYSKDQKLIDSYTKICKG